MVANPTIINIFISLLKIDGFAASSVTTGPPVHNSDLSFFTPKIVLLTGGPWDRTPGSTSLTTISVTDFFLPKNGLMDLISKESANSSASSSTDSIDKTFPADPASRFKSLKLFLEEVSIDPRG